MADTPNHPQSKEELMSVIEREYAALMQAARQLTPEQMTAPDAGGWSPKDNLAHLSAWMNFLLKAHLASQPAHTVLGMEVAKFRALDEDGINAVIFERNHSRPAAEILAEIENTYQETVRTLQAMSWAALLKPFRRDDPLQRPVIGWVTGNTSEHFAEHRGYIERVLKVPPA